MEGDVAFDGMYESIGFIWSAVGGDSTTSRLYSRGGAEGDLFAGYGEVLADWRSLRALREGGDEG